MRQAGIVAAAGVYALDHNVDRLADDHARARRLGEAWAAAGLPVDLELVQTNFVQLDVASLGLTEEEALARIHEQGVLLSQTRPGVLRAVTRWRSTTRRSSTLSPQFPAHSRLFVSEKREQLDRLLQETQADRLPSVAAAVVRKGEIVWANAVGGADYEAGLDATPGTQYRIGSITKTFTATAIMQLRDLGRLDLDDRLGQHLDDVGDGSPTIRRMLAHISGLQREVGEMFVDLTMPTEDDLVVGFALEPARAHHYSNLAFGLLGRVVAAKSGDAVRTVRRREGHSAARARADDVALGQPRGAGLPRRRLRAHGLGRARARSRRRRGDGAALVDGRGPRALGDLPRARRGGCARPEDGRGDVVPAGHVLPRRLGARLGARADALQPGAARSSGGHGGAMPGPPGGRVREPQDPDRRCGADELGLARRHGRARSSSPRRRWSSGPSRSRRGGRRKSRRRTSARSSAVWYSEGTQFVFTWEKGSLRAKVTGSAARPRGDDVRTRRRRVDRRRPAANAASACASRASGSIWAGYPFTRAQQPFAAGSAGAGRTSYASAWSCPRSAPPGYFAL